MYMLKKKKVGRPKGSCGPNKKYRSHWTAKDEQEFKKLYHKMSNKELQKHFNKSQYAIYNKAREFKLIKIGTVAHYNEKQIINNTSLENLCGLYFIQCLINNKFYIGYTSNLGYRFQTHVRFLNQNKHENRNLQQDYNKLGRDNFGYGVLKYTNTEHEAMKLEARYLYGLDSTMLYNTTIKHQILNLTYRQVEYFLSFFDKTRVEFKFDPLLKNLKYKGRDKASIIIRDKEECLLWTRKTCKDGYGQIKLTGRTWPAHRLMYFLFSNKPFNGLVVRHKCDNKLCCNPYHLELGSDKDNMNDRLRLVRNGNKKVSV